MTLSAPPELRLRLGGAVRLPTCLHSCSPHRPLVTALPQSEEMAPEDKRPISSDVRVQPLHLESNKQRPGWAGQPVWSGPARCWQRPADGSGSGSLVVAGHKGTYTLAGNSPDLTVQTLTSSWLKASAAFSHSSSLTQREFSGRSTQWLLIERQKSLLSFAQERGAVDAVNDP